MFSSFFTWILYQDFVRIGELASRRTIFHTSTLNFLIYLRWSLVVQEVAVVNPNKCMRGCLLHEGLLAV